MTCFVLIHGGWHGGWCWERVAPLLSGSGYQVTTPTLRGLGDRADEASPDVSVDDHAAEVVTAVRAAAAPVILVAHSYAGAPVEVAAPDLADRVARIVHLDSFALEDGEAILDVFPPPVAEAVLGQVAATGDGWRVDPLPPSLLGLDQADDIAAVMPRLTPQPLRTMQQTVRLRRGGEAIPRTYVECLVGAETKPFGLYADRARRRGWDSRTLAAGHEAMITAPALLASLLVELAAAAEAPARADPTLRRGA